MTAKSESRNVETRSQGKSARKSEPQHEKEGESSDHASTAGTKRKEAPESNDNGEEEAPPKKSSKATDAQAVIKFLLSDEALSLCRNPKSQSRHEKEGRTGKHAPTKDYFSSDLTPFEHLVCALILSRPISHVLGQRTITTVLNAPWDWHDAQAIIDAGREIDEDDDDNDKTERVAAMEDARTQHRQKTAAQLGDFAETVVARKWDPERDGKLAGLLKETEHSNPDAVRKVLKQHVKGFGDTSASIFLRRVQACPGWENVGYYIDSKTQDALKDLGLPGEGDELKKLVEDGEHGNVHAVFVTVLERALGIMLEGKQDRVS